MKGPKVTIATTFQNSLKDRHTILASLKGHRDAGFLPVTVESAKNTVVTLMLLPRQPEFEFASMEEVNADHTALAGLLRRTFGEATPKEYELLQGETRRPDLACLMNIIEALAVVKLPQGGVLRPTLVDYIERLDPAPSLDWIRPDRFFAWCHSDVATAVRALPQLFHQAPKGLHRGATDSFKQFGFGEANVQVTLHENDKGTTSNGQEVIKVEFDIDYFRDSGAHLLLEVFPNTLKKFVFGADSSESLTDPTIVYGLRWIAGRAANAAPQARPFEPAYTIRPLNA